MWKQNFMFRQHESDPLDVTENDLYNDTEPAADSAGLTLERYISVWIQGDGDDATPAAYTNVYVRTASLDQGLAEQGLAPGLGGFGRSLPGGLRAGMTGSANLPSGEHRRRRR